MSVASALATIEKVSRFSYVGGTERTKEGVGVVINGKEKMIFSDNPWNQMALLRKREISLLFNQGRYAPALDTTRRIIPLVEGEMKSCF